MAGYRGPDIFNAGVIQERISRESRLSNNTKLLRVLQQLGKVQCYRIGCRLGGVSGVYIRTKPL